jgi:hypothetical protein
VLIQPQNTDPPSTCALDVCSPWAFEHSVGSWQQPLVFIGGGGACDLSKLDPFAGEQEQAELKPGCVAALPVSEHQTHGMGDGGRCCRLERQACGLASGVTEESWA